jgi:hypothetical protein
LYCSQNFKLFGFPIFRFAAASDKVYQLLAHGRWFSPGTPVSSTNETDRHDITEILLNVALNTITLTQLIWAQKSIAWVQHTIAWGQLPNFR